jgi:hypothetical protein
MHSVGSTPIPVCGSFGFSRFVIVIVALRTSLVKVIGPDMETV